MSNLIEKKIVYYEKNSSLIGLKTDLENLPYSFDKCSLTLKEVYNVLYDTVYSKWVVENKDVKEALCFTMVTNDYTIDFECASELERNAIARGFTILIKHLEDSEAS